MGIHTSAATLQSYIPQKLSGLILPLAFALLAVCAGCAGSGGSRLDEKAIAQRHLPTVRDVPHPDSLTHVAIRQDDGRIKVQLDRSLGALQQQWSATYQRVMGHVPFRTRTYQTYATLQGLELTLAQFAYSTGLEGLTSDRQHALFDKKRTEHQSRIAIDVNVFVNANEAAPFDTNLNASDIRIRLRDDTGHEYKPIEIQVHGAALRTRETPFLESGAFYRTNTIYFNRVVDGTDVLNTTNRLELVLETTRSNQPSRLVFAWTWMSKSGA